MLRSGDIAKGILVGVEEPERIFTELAILSTCLSAKAKALAHLSRQARTRGDLELETGSDAAFVRLAGHSETVIEGTTGVSSLVELV